MANHGGKKVAKDGGMEGWVVVGGNKRVLLFAGLAAGR
jgi:hypothetical protein